MTSSHNMVPQLHIHPILWLFALTAVLTGTLAEFLIIFFIVIVHELGHYFTAKWYGWRIRKINLWVFGGVMETEEHSSRPIREEAWIVAAGPLQHLWIYALLFSCKEISVVPASLIEIGFLYNTTILLFNLLPIWPLDGGKMVFLLLSYFLPFKLAHTMTIVSSIAFSLFAAVSFVLFFPFTLSAVMLTGFILWENRLEWKQRYYIFLRFLLKRYLTATPEKPKIRPVTVAPSTRLLHVFFQFKRGQTHHIYVKPAKRDSDWLEEQTCLHAYFKMKQHQMSAGELLSRSK
ncbi:stage IV sporulation protein FB [Sediminibacillus dalangtanensis]|uniref:Stage IV sporulation protein FB n=1 Tax=Sediminibacillus dalangtanensis TaxID=2729421 RepID=A0ABX7VSM7_9BACI|nr:M50 family metallopeptidase [Sediminibacillus dalangtanensis]QTM99952.1 stage IV sporulation protein FB [Sediminibacillus dalangtanensis]